ncbi:MAG TPA: MlaE family lipid ABC transporter permease subunit [Candidatus Kryptonia bacterium]|nr:MlaE family lipid ABC transporter permease subunit [Candidatus Kryptonia bacterium]
MADEVVVAGPTNLHTLDGAKVLLEQGRAALIHGRALVVDLSGCGAIGSNGAAALLSLRHTADSHSLSLTVRGVTADQLRELSELPAPQMHGEGAEHDNSLYVYLGSIAEDVVEQCVDFLSLMADTFYWSAQRLLRRGPWRQGQFVREAIAIGNEGLPIVAVVSLLVGLVTAFQAADQLRQFGASIFIANLVGLGVLREMGPLITAILIAGRSGSAMAAELGTMAVEEEIDALRVMGIDPVPYLVVPKAFATVVGVPALTMLANLFGVLGGFIIAVGYLDLAPDAFFTQLNGALVPWDLLTGMIKSVLFAAVIVSVGCHFGLRLRGGAEDVGRAATNAVVASLFLIILVDGIYVTIETVIT